RCVVDGNFCGTRPTRLAISSRRTRSAVARPNDLVPCAPLPPPFWASSYATAGLRRLPPRDIDCCTPPLAQGSRAVHAHDRPHTLASPRRPPAYVTPVPCESHGAMSPACWGTRSLSYPKPREGFSPVQI